MPHFIVEYTANLKDETDIPMLLEKINETIIARGDVFPIGGLRSRAIEVQDYRIADGAEDDAFVHSIFKIGAGRSFEVKKEVCDALFEVVKEHFKPLMAKRNLALSMELYEFGELSDYKENNIHKRFKK